MIAAFVFYALKWDDETQMSANAHAAPGVKQSMSSYGRLATICNAMPAPVWRCILLSAVVTVVSEVFASPTEAD